MNVDDLVSFAERHDLSTEAIAELLSLVRRSLLDTGDVPRVTDQDATLVTDGITRTAPSTSAELDADGLPVTVPLPAHKTTQRLRGVPLLGTDTAPLPPTKTSPLRVERFEDLGLLGLGATGEVRRVRDPELGRVIALKVLRPEAAKKARAVLRFLEESRTTAQLQHPGIPPVFETGTTSDGRFWFTMPEVRGKTLRHVMAELHEASRNGQWATSPSGWSLRRVVAAFQRVCEAVAYAHSRGFVHCDIKPSNVMVGDHGEVLLVDWGLARNTAHTPAAADTSPSPTAESSGGGPVAGTPMYMAPEQARGEVDRIDARTDVYALGTILYELLTGRTPYAGRRATEVLVQLIAAAPTPLRTHEGVLGLPRDDGDDEGQPPLPIPPELSVACNRAMAREPDDRFADARDLAAEVGDWLDGIRKRDRALEIVQQAGAITPEANALRARAAELRNDARTLLYGVPGWASEDRKAPGWRRLDEAESLERRAELHELEAELLLHAALTHAPALPEAHEALADRYRSEHERGEEADDATTTTRAENLLRIHAGSLPEPSPARDDHFAYLEGDGSLTLDTDPPGAEVALYTNIVRNRRRVQTFDRVLGITPLRGVPLPMGSYVAMLASDDHRPVRYPVRAGRQQHVVCAPPDGEDACPIALPPSGSLAHDEIYVAAGWFEVGGDPLAPRALPRTRLWLDALVVRRFPVTNEEYLRFLDSLVDAGSEELALRHVPRDNATEGEVGAPLYERFGRGEFHLRDGAGGLVWRHDTPVTMVDLASARAYARWYADRTRQPWRLPGELEWEKAARGADGRAYPWGDVFDPSWAHTRESHVARPGVAPVDSCPVDDSVYGVRGMAGNTLDWCETTYRPDGPRIEGDRVAPSPSSDPEAARVIRGGGWLDGSVNARVAARRSLVPDRRRDDLGIRLFRDHA